MNTESPPSPQNRNQSEPADRLSQHELDSAASAPVLLAPLPQTESPLAPNGEVLQAELRELKDRYLRLAADFDNFKKRTAQEAEIRAAARKEVFILELLPAIDSLDRALACDGSASREQLHQGVKMISLQLLQLLHRHDIKPDDCLGRPFNPHRHEAIGTGHDAAQPARGFPTRLDAWAGRAAPGPRDCQ